ncbi:hypothetical protein JTB14_026933 [Gonioctena quinquepunctata]|nr:hypothetical protein JTB14_026933 [Gonioctena quinquepunctata]
MTFTDLLKLQARSDNLKNRTYIILKKHDIQRNLRKFKIKILIVDDLSPEEQVVHKTLRGYLNIAKKKWDESYNKTQPHISIVVEFFQKDLEAF